jgi:hypothetical protein
MGIRRHVACGLVLALCACDVSAGGLNPSPVDAFDGDASNPMPAPVLDAAAESMEAGAEASLADATPVDSTTIDPCPVSGTYALTLQAAVHWEGTSLFQIVPIILPGDGMVVVKTLIDIAPTPEHAVTVRACGAQIPDFASSIGETYGADFPDEMWDRLPLRWNTRAHFECTNSGCAFEAEPVTAQLGIDVPANAAWPSPRDPIAASAQRDDDRDGLPGVHLRMRGPAEGAYQHPPTSFLLVRRVSDIQLAIRLNATIDGALSSCDTRGGLTHGMTLDIRALACTVENGGACAEDELGFIDDNLPVWTVQSATFQAQRLPANATCGDVRSL